MTYIRHGTTHHLFHQECVARSSSQPEDYLQIFFKGKLVSRFNSNFQLPLRKQISKDVKIEAEDSHPNHHQSYVCLVLESLELKHKLSRHTTIQLVHIYERVYVPRQKQHGRRTRSSVPIPRSKTPRGMSR